MNFEIDEDILFEINILRSVDLANVLLPQLLIILRGVVAFPFCDANDYFETVRHCLDICEDKINQCAEDLSMKFSIKESIDEIIGLIVKSFAVNTLYDRMADVDQTLCVFRKYLQLFSNEERMRLFFHHRRKFEEFIMSITSTADFGTQLRSCELMLEYSTGNKRLLELLIEIFKNICDSRFEDISKILCLPAPESIRRNRIKSEMTAIIRRRNENMNTGMFIFNPIRVTFNGKAFEEYFNLFSGLVAFNTDGKRLTFHFDTISSEYESPMIAVDYKDIVNMEAATSFCYYTNAYFRVNIKSPMTVIYSNNDIKNNLQQRIQSITTIEIFFSDIQEICERLVDAYQTTNNCWLALK